MVASERGVLEFVDLVARTRAAAVRGDAYPDPKEHCDICRWREPCDKRRRDDDHLCLVAGISKLQINELKQRGIATVQSLAGILNRPGFAGGRLV